jgi:hypothetical protein
MRTALFIAAGCLIWGVWSCIAKLWSSAAGSMNAALVVFLAGWFAVAATNMWFGVSRAGYAFREELPILALIFAVPALLAIFVKWKWFGVAHG